MAAMEAARKSTGLTAAEIGRIEATGAKLAGVGRSLTTFVTAPLTLMAAGAVTAAMSWESSFAGVTKTVDGTTEQMAALEQGLRDMSKELPATHGEIAAVAEAAGQLGVGVEDIEDFSRVMLDLGETTNLSADQAATALARFMNIMGTAQSDVDRVGSTVVDLGNNFASTEAEIVEFALRLAAAGRQAGLSESDVMAFGTALSSVGVNAEAGGTAFSKVFRTINDAVIDGGDKLETFASVAGMSASRFVQAYEQDAATAIVAFVSGLGDIAARGESTTGILKDLGLSNERVQAALLGAGQAGDLLSDALARGSTGWSENTALTEEAAKRYETTAAQFEMVRNKIVDLFIDLGEIILPAVAQVVDVLGALAEKFQGLPEPIQAAALALGGLAAAAGPVVFVAGSLMRNWQTLSLAFGNSTGPMGRASRALGALSIAAGTALAVWEILGEGHVGVAHSVDATTQALASAIIATLDAADAARAAGQDVDRYSASFEALGTAIRDGLDEPTRDALDTLGVSASETLTVMEDITAGVEGQIDVTRRFFGFAADEAKRFLVVLHGDDFTIPQIAQAFNVSEEAVRNFSDALFQVGNFAAEGREELARYTEDFLNELIRGGGGLADMIHQIEQDWNLQRSVGEDAISIYSLLSQRLQALTPEQRKNLGVTEEMLAAMGALAPAAEGAADGISDIGASAGDMADKVDAASIVVESAIDRFTKKAQGLNDFWSSTMSDIVDGRMGLYDANQAIWESENDFADALDDTHRGLESNTEAGRQNADAVQQWAQRIMDQTALLIESGASAEYVAGNYEHNREALLDNAEAQGLNREAVENLLNAWGMTPELVTTTYDMRGVEAAREQVEIMLDQIDEIPPDVATDIQADINEGDYESAIRRLHALENPVRVPVDIWVRTVPRVGVNNGQVTYDYGVRSGQLRQVASADGRFTDGPMVSLIGEAGREGVYPFERPHRLDAMLSDPRSAPMWASMSRLMGGAMGGGSSTTYQFGDIVVGSRDEAHGIVNALGDAMFIARHAA